MNSPFFAAIRCVSFVVFLSFCLPFLRAEQVADTSQEAVYSLEDTKLLESFMDGLIQAYLDNQQIAGATVGIIHNGEIRLLKGYGYANIEKGIRVDPEVSMFRIGSISKLFTWIAVLQQYEAGRLDLDTDINTYLTAFKIPDRFDEPVTLRSLLTHTPGFEDILIELFIHEETPMPDLEEMFQKRLPRRIMPPLTEAAYSNHGTGLAQYIVEQISGLPFEEYVEQFILEPLGMYCTTFRQPLPENLQPFLSNGYAMRDGRFVAQPKEIIPMTGAGGASSTAKDMLIFLKALMNNASIDTINILDAATYAIMKEPLLTHAAHMNPVLHGFLDMSPAHIKVIGHGGNTFLFHSFLAMLPEHDAGIFISFNSENGSMTSYDVMKQFIERFWPEKESPTQAINLHEGYLKGFTGTYIPNRRPHSDALKLVGTLMSVKVFMDEGNLMYRDFTGQINTMAPVDSTTFFVEGEKAFIGFQRQGNDRADKLYVSNFPIMAFDKAKGLMNLQLHAVLFIITLLVMLYILVFWPWIYFIRRNYEKTLRTPHPLPVFTKLVAWIASLFFFVFIILMIQATSGGTDIVFGIPSSMRVALFFPLAAIPLILLMIYSTLFVWKTPKIRKTSKLFYTLATLAYILTTWQLYYWNLLGWQY